jgi:hypothetical protein
MEYRETQYAPAWVWTLLGGIGAISGYIGYRAAIAAGAKVGWAAWPGVAVVLVMIALSRMTTRVDGDGLTVVYGLLPIYTKRVEFADIVSAEAETYHPLREFGGWGIRGMGKSKALTMHGNRGVRMTLRNGDRLLIGSNDPETFAQVLRVRAGL